MGNILEKLEEERVVAFYLSGDHSKINVNEACDRWFGVELSKDEFGKMIAELQELHNSMI